MAQRNRRSNLGVLLLASELYRYGFDRIPPITLATIAGQVALYLDFFKIPSVHTNLDVCISALSVWYKQDWKRLFLSPFFHGDDFHLYYNMSSYLIKGSSLEKRWGSTYFLYVLAVFSVLTSLVYVGIAFLAERFLGDSSYLTQCAVGFSGVIFALKVVTTHYLPPNSNTFLRYVYLPIPAHYACWAELVLIQLITPNASFLGHLAGIVVGYLYIKGPLKYIMDTFYFDSNNRQSYRNRNTHDNPRTYGSGSLGYNPNQYTGGLSEEEQLRGLYGQQPGYGGGTRPSAPPYPTPGYVPSPEEIRNRRADRWL